MSSHRIIYFILFFKLGVNKVFFNIIYFSYLFSILYNYYYKDLLTHKDKNTYINGVF